MCQIDSDYGEPPTFYKTVLRKAKKLHRCFECKRWIIPGELYEIVVGKWEGTMDYYKTCHECYEIRERFFTSFCHGQLWNDLWECDDFDLEQLDGLSKRTIIALSDFLDKKEEFD